MAGVFTGNTGMEQHQMNGFHIWQLKYREKKHHPNGVKQ